MRLQPPTAHRWVGCSTRPPPIWRCEPPGTCATISAIGSPSGTSRRTSPTAPPTSPGSSRPPSEPRPSDYLAAWRLHEAKHLLVAHRMGVAETCHEVGYTSVGTFSRRFLRDVGIPPGALRRIADRIAERTLPAVSLLVPAAGRIRVRPEVPEEMRRALGPVPYQWVGTFPRPVPSGLPATGTLRRGIDEVELPVVPGAPWILATILPRRRQRPRAPGPHKPSRREAPCPVGTRHRRRHPSGARRPPLGSRGPRGPGGDGRLTVV